MKKFLLFFVFIGCISVNSLTQDIQDTTKTVGLLTVGNNIDFFNKPYDHILLVHPLGIGYKGANTTLIAYYNRGNLIQETPLITQTFKENQFEVDFYHKISNSTNYWINYAYSNSPHFPKYRIMGRAWQTLGSSDFRISGGGKYFYFDNGLLTTTFGLEKYFRNFWVEGKIYTYFKNPETRFSYQINSRLFWNDINYISLSLMSGAAQDEPWISYDVLHASTAIVGVTSFIDKKHKSQIRANVGYSIEEYYTDMRRNRFTGSISLTFYIF